MRRALLLSALACASALTLLVAACTEGTTPDCRSPDAACGPGVDGSTLPEASEGGPVVDAPVDGQRDATSDAGCRDSTVRVST